VTERVGREVAERPIPSSESGIVQDAFELQEPLDDPEDATPASIRFSM
jgi:hypothetical protein